MTRAELVAALDAFRTHLDGFRLDADADLAAALAAGADGRRAPLRGVEGARRKP